MANAVVLSISGWSGELIKLSMKDFVLENLAASI